MPYTLPSFEIVELPFEISPITVDELTTETVDGTGVFDKLMRTNKAHLEQEFQKTRIKGPEYATVYLGSLQSVLQASIQFLLERDKTTLAALMLKQQYILAQVEVMKAAVQLAILEQSLLKLPAELAMLAAQTAVQVQQRLNLIAEEEGIRAKTALTEQQTLNAGVEFTVLVAQECKLRAEYNLLLDQILKAKQEVLLLAQKVATERAQTDGSATSTDSQIGRQNALYMAQAAGFARDAEQKAAKMMIETWSVRRGTNEGELANMENLLHDTKIGQAVAKMFVGVGIT